MILEGAAGAPWRSRAAHRRRRAAWFRIWVGLLRSRQFHERVLLGAIGVAALIGIAREAQARSLARLIAWDKQQSLRRLRAAKPRPARGR